MDFFPVRGDNAGFIAAKAVCADCPVREPCLAYAVEGRDVGVWGGTADHERQKLRRASGVPARYHNLRAVRTAVG